VAVGGVELRAIQPISGVGSGDQVDISIRPDDCIVLPEAAGEVATN